jgi:hypothetical protein
MVPGLFYFAAITSAFVTYFVWDDRPDASDAGRHSLSSWLVATFGVHWARPAGTAIFSVLTLLFTMVGVLSLRWLQKLNNPGGSNVGS